MQTHFDIELEKLRNKIQEMGELVEVQLSSVIDALLRGDTELAQKIIEADNLVDSVDVKIDKLCQRIFALAQPVASDLRFIMSALKINNDLERVGDIAVSIAKKVEGVSENIAFLQNLKIDEIALEGDNIIKQAVLSFSNKDTGLACQIINDSPKINEKCDLVSNEIVNAMIAKSEVIVVATNLILILRQIKRLADHASNIAEAVIFMVEGRNVKHSRT